MKAAGGAFTGAAAMVTDRGHAAEATAPRGPDFDVRSFGAKGDGKTLDTPAINRAIDAAAHAGRGTVVFPARTYLCYSIRLKSQIAVDPHLKCRSIFIRITTRFATKRFKKADRAKSSGKQEIAS